MATPNSPSICSGSTTGAGIAATAIGRDQIDTTAILSGTGVGETGNRKLTVTDGGSSVRFCVVTAVF